MYTQKSFLFVLVVSLLMGTTSSPVLVETNSASLRSSLHTWKKAETIQLQVSTAPITVCASGCDFSSIQEAIDAANDGDTIDLASEIYNETITIDKSVDLIGDGIDNTIIQAAESPGIATSSVITTSAGITVTIDSLTIRYGRSNIPYPQIGGGGGIFDNGRSLTISNTRIISNSAEMGGGIFSYYGSVVIANSIIEDNIAASEGGGIYAYSSDVSISGSMIKNNSPEGIYLIVGSQLFAADSIFQGNQGVGIYNDTDFVDLYNCTIKDNQGTGIVNDEGILNIEFSSVNNNGSGISNYGGTLTAQYCNVNGNLGVGIHNTGNAEISNSAISDNLNTGLYNNAELTLSESTVSNNSSVTDGGGIYNYFSGTAYLNNSTISGNSANNNGGGIYNLGMYILATNSTVSNNSADTGGGIYNYSDMKLVSSIIANSKDIGGDCINLGEFRDGGYNLIEDGSCGFPASGDLLLGSLQDNGGPTWTHALLPNSPAVDAIPVYECIFTSDQRGFPRPIGSSCDIGAFEMDGVTIKKSVNDEYALPGQVITFTIQAQNTSTTTLSNAIISDSLPTGLEFIGPITIEPSGSGTTGFPPTLVSDLTINPRSWVTVTLPVTVSANNTVGMVITNTTTISSPITFSAASSSQAIVVCGENITVTNSEDSGPGSLRAALAAVCPNGSINFSLPIPTTITLTTGELKIDRTVRVNGPGYGNLSISANRNSRVFYVTGEDVIISGLTIRDGVTQYGHSGGGIYNIGTLTVLDSVLTNNLARDRTQAVGGGGGIYNANTIVITNTFFISNTAEATGGGGGGLINLGYATIANSVFRNNHAVTSSAYGGGIQGTQDSNTQIENCLIENNFAEDSGGGINGRYARITIRNSTISNNLALKDGGALNNDRSYFHIVNSTLSGNTANINGGAIWSYNGVTELENSTLNENIATGAGNDIFQDSGYLLTSARNTIFASNQSGDSCAGNDYTDLYSRGYNLGIDQTCGLTEPSDLVNTDPLLQPLANNGGSTSTYALEMDSPAIDNGSCMDLDGVFVLQDQRGILRPQGIGCDIGAFEFEQAVEITKSANISTPVPGEIITFTIQVYNNQNGSVTNGLISDTLRSGLNFIGPISLIPPFSGDTGTEPPFLVTNLAIAAGQKITVTFPVSISLGLTSGTVITNTAWITSEEVLNPVPGITKITIANAPPRCMDDSGIGFLTYNDIPFITASVLINDLDSNNDQLSIIDFNTSGTLGMVSYNGSGTFTYDPNGKFDYLAPGEQAEDHFIYTVSDGSLTDTAVVTITIQRGGNSPTFFPLILR